MPESAPAPTTWGDLCAPTGDPSLAQISTAGLAAHHTAADPSSVSAGWDFFTNFGSYMPRTQCMVDQAGRTDWPWVILLLVTTLGVIVGYARIFHFWVRCYVGERKEDRNPRLMQLAWIFLWCAVCGYAMSILMFVWPAYRLLCLFLIVLNWWTWKFASRLSGFRSAFSAGRLERELADVLRSRNDELERMVGVRTAEANEARRAAEHASRAKSDFLAHMSHEIRTPMTAILGYADLITQPDQTASEREDAARTILRNGEHLLSVLNDLLDISKIEAGQITVEPLTVPIRRTLDQVVDLMRARASAKGIELWLDVHPDTPQALVTDPVRLRQILLNLMGNAIKFTHQGGVSVMARGLPATPINPAGGVEFQIQDTGIGMSADTLARLFQPFTQADASMTRQYGGTGLGLAISRRLARILGGDLQVVSALGTGSLFTLTIAPLADSTRQAASGSTPLPTRAADSRAAHAARILLVEDGQDNRRLFLHHLSRAGFSVRIAEDGQDAVEIVQREGGPSAPFDAILMDMQMPRLDGYGAASRLRAMGFAGPIIALTAHAMSGDRERCVAAGCTDYLTKPIEAARLVQACDDAIRTEPSRREAA